MNIVAFTGSGISKESGIDTFRDKDGLWENFNVEDYATPAGWKKDREEVLDFYNDMRRMCVDLEPNSAHNYLHLLERDNDVTIITQNVDDLHEKSGSTNVLHLHGELNKSQSSLDRKLTYPLDKDILIGDKCEKGSQLRPHVVWFGEDPNNVEQSYDALGKCDLLLIVGTSLEITYTLELLASIDENKTSVIYIDPDPSDYMDGICPVEYIREVATKGMKEVYDGITT